MTQQVKMPEPFGWLLDCLPNGGIAFQREQPSGVQSLINSTVAVITTDQAQAYANARVREALEQAAHACEARLGQRDDGMNINDVADCDEEARQCADAVRSLKRLHNNQERQHVNSK